MLAYAAVWNSRMSDRELNWEKRPHESWVLAPYTGGEGMRTTFSLWDWYLGSHQLLAKHRSLFSCWVVSFFPIFYIQIPFITIHLGTLPGIQCFIEGDVNLISNGTASLIVILKFGNTF